VAAERLSMRKIKEVVRLTWDQGLTDRTIARSVSIARSTVGEYLRGATDAGLGWPLPAELDEAELKRRLFPPAPGVSAGSRVLPNWTEIHGELKRRGVTLFLLWEEYRQANPAEGGATSTAGSVSNTAGGLGNSISSCARSTGPERSSLLTMPGRALR
jgi:hypothetical protein